jgi:hypothetical protein
MISSLSLLEIINVDGFGPSAIFRAQYNPSSYRHSYRNVYQQRQGINVVGTLGKFLYSQPEELSFTLDLEDDEEDMDLPLFISVREGVRKKVDKFLKVCYLMDGSKHRPNLLSLYYGGAQVSCYLVSLDVHYLAFAKSGVPVRAELDCVFRTYEEDPVGRGSKSSPDLTHAITTKQWETLPMLSEQIYGDPHLYVQIAEANGLDHFRKLRPGGKLYFPPTQKDQSEA